MACTNNHFRETDNNGFVAKALSVAIMLKVVSKVFGNKKGGKFNKQRRDKSQDDFPHGDVHLYLNHIEQAKLQLSRLPLFLLKLQFKRKPKTIFDYEYEDFEILNYQPYSHIVAPIAV
ncbi:MAG TPA: thymidylate synthase [Pedobacter sp.]|jgi:thymidylate synthase